MQEEALSSQPKGELAGVRVPSRRSFLNWLLGTALAGLAGSAIYSLGRYLFPERDKAQAGSVQEVPIGLKKDLIPGRSVKFRYGGYPAILINLNGTYYAYGAICTHLGCIVHWKDVRGCAMEMGDEIHCVCHAGHFDPRTGNVISGPPPSPLPKLKIAEKGEQIVAVGWDSPEYIGTLTTYKS